MPSARLVQGSIVWAEVLDPRRSTPKKRPLVVITHTDEILLDADIVAVAVTSSFPHPAPPEFVELPWSAPRHPATSLGKRSAAACNWLVTLRPSQIVEVKGYVPQKYLLEILTKVRRINEPGDEGT